MKSLPKQRRQGKRSKRGTGRLYKRDADGKEHPADWRGAGS